MTRLLNEWFDAVLLKRHAVIEVETTASGTSFSVVPFDERHARVDAYYENGLPIIYLTIADNTVLEVPIEGGRYTSRVGLDELRSIIQGVIEKGLDEDVWEVNGKVVRSVANLHVAGEDKPIRFDSASLHNPFAEKKKISKRYFPYF